MSAVSHQFFIDEGLAGDGQSVREERNYAQWRCLVSTKNSLLSLPFLPRWAQSYEGVEILVIMRNLFKKS